MNISEINCKACTGCLACVFSCPINCIKITRDNEGFVVPQVDGNECIDCGKCVRSCGALRESMGNQFTFGTYAAKRQDKEAIMRSSSGGMASLISEWVISCNGIVYGAVMDNDMIVRHRRVDTMSEIDSLRGSKYVQSEMTKVYETIKEDCQSGKLVALFGTPCQIYGVKQYLNFRYCNLILVDLICHGVPSPELYSNYLKWKTGKFGKEQILEYRFRDKGLYGWDTVYKISTKKRVEMKEATRDPYYFSFIYAQTYRECCYECKFANLDRVGDLTLGDFWGVEEEHPELRDEIYHGISAVLCNTETGRWVLDNIAGDAVLTETTVDKVARKNPNLVEAAVRPQIRDFFYTQVRDKGFEWACSCMKSDKRYYMEFFKRKVPKSIKTKIKYLLKNRG